MSRKSGKTNIQFEKSLARLEEIVEKLESGEVSLSDAIGLYEEGITLSKNCIKQLNEVETKLKKITAELDGTFRVEDIT
jgi:exodeoxyribonuclease VII small subunit